MRARVVILALAAVGLAAAPAVPARAGESGADAARLDAIVAETLRTQHVPALTVAIARAGRVVYSRAFGSADLENAVAATPDTRMRTGSIAKSITAVAAMTLVEAGRLDLDAPVQTYCPPFPPKQWPITTRELLGHTSGIRHYRGDEIDNTRHYRFTADGLAIFAADPLLFVPGTGYQYSTYGYTVVGCVVEGSARERFQDYVAEHVLKPADMPHTVVDDVYEIVPHRARGYEMMDGEVKNAPLMDSSYKIAGGGYVSTALDLVHFGTALLDGRLLKPATLAQMWVASPASGKSSYGYGFEVRDGGRVVLHTGGQPGCSTILVIMPQSQLVIAVLANLEHVPLRDTVGAMLRQLQMPAVTLE